MFSIPIFQFPYQDPQSPVQHGSSSGVADTASLLSSDSRLGQPPVIDLIYASPDSGVVHDDFNPLSSTSHGHSVASSSHDHSPPPRKTVQSHSILVDENQSTCTSNHSTAPFVVNILFDSMDTQLHYIHIMIIIINTHSNEINLLSLDHTKCVL